jgi:hypothetical protein
VARLRRFERPLREDTPKGQKERRLPFSHEMRRVLFRWDQFCVQAVKHRDVMFPAHDQCGQRTSPPDEGLFLKVGSAIVNEECIYIDESTQEYLCDCGHNYSIRVTLKEIQRPRRNNHARFCIATVPAPLAWARIP